MPGAGTPVRRVSGDQHDPLPRHSPPSRLWTRSGRTPASATAKAGTPCSSTQSCSAANAVHLGHVAVFVILVRDVLQLPPAAYGALVAAGTVGGVIGGAAASRISRAAGGFPPSWAASSSSAPRGPPWPRPATSPWSRWRTAQAGSPSCSGTSWGCPCGKASSPTGCWAGRRATTACSPGARCPSALCSSACSPKPPDRARPSRRAGRRSWHWPWSSRPPSSGTAGHGTTGGHWRRKPERHTTAAGHNSRTLRALFDHDAEGDIKSTTAAYETPVSDLLWHATVPVSTPTEVVGTLQDTPTTENARARGTSTGITSATIAGATRPLPVAGWKHALDGRCITWEAPVSLAAGVQVRCLRPQ